MAMFYSCLLRVENSFLVEFVSSIVVSSSIFRDLGYLTLSIGFVSTASGKCFYVLKRVSTYSFF